MESVVQALTVSAIIFFNAFCFIGIIAFAVMIKAFKKVKEKSEETFDMAQGVLYNINDSVERANEGFLGDIIGFFGNMFASRASSRGGIFGRRR